MDCNHPGYYIVLESEVFGREEVKQGGPLSIKPEVRQLTVCQARMIQCLKCLKVYTLNPQLRENRN